MTEGDSTKYCPYCVLNRCECGAEHVYVESQSKYKTIMVCECCEETWEIEHDIPKDKQDREFLW